MTCTNCAASVKKTLEKLGAKKVTVTFTTGEASFIGSLEISSVKKALNKRGFKVVSATENLQKSFLNIRFYISLIFTLPLLAHMVLPDDSILHNKFLQLGLCIPVIIVGGTHFLKSAFYSLKTGLPNMDVLISTGFTSAFLYSVYGVFIANNSINFLFFETAASIITLVLLGNIMEEKAIKKTTTALGELESLRPRIVRKITNGDQIERVDVTKLKVDEFVRVNTGDQIPIDGIIASGELELDESIITGESKPIYKNTLTHVVSGSTVISGSAVVRVTEPYGKATIDRIIDMVKNAQHLKPKIQRVGDQISHVFVPVIIILSLATFFFSKFYLEISVQSAILRSVAILVVSCPCAMGLAAPTAIMVGIGKLAKEGVLIKGGSTLEKLAKSNLVVFDKTGTLTTGEFVLKKLNYYKESEEKIKQVILSLEQQSNHPIAESLVKALSKDVGPIYLQDLIEIKGKGVKGTDSEDNTYQLVSNNHAKTITTRELTSDLVLFNGTSVVAELWIKDRAKIDAEETISWLKAHGYRTMLLSGDNRKNCEEIVRELYLDDYYYEKSPEEKLRIIEKLNKDYNVIMIGDGINDAPSLALAHVGISFGAATDIARSSSEVILVDKNLSALKTALTIGKQTYRTIIQNFLWALSYNLVAIPIAAAGLLKPIIASLSMAFSDLIVIGNSISLRYKKGNQPPKRVARKRKY